MKGELVSSYRDVLLANIDNLDKAESLTISNITNMEMIISPKKVSLTEGTELLSKDIYEMDITNCEAIYKAIEVKRSDLEYYINIYQKATTEAESYNVYLLASKGLKVGDKIEIVEKSTGNKTTGIISAPNKHYYGLYYKYNNPYSKLKTIDLLLDNFAVWNLIR